MALPGAARVVCLRQFYARQHPTVAAHWSDTEPSIGSEIQNRASVTLLPFPSLSRF